jgi:hypothetical protein
MGSVQWGMWGMSGIAGIITDKYSAVLKTSS